MRGISEFATNVNGMDTMNENMRSEYAAVNEVESVARNGGFQETGLTMEESMEKGKAINAQIKDLERGASGGVWVPPVEGVELENNSVDDLLDNEAFINYAKVMYDEFNDDMASPAPGTGHAPVDHKTDRDKANWAIAKMNAMNWNSPAAVKSLLQYANIEDEEVGKATLNVMNMYEYADNTMGNAALSAMNVAMDPITYLGGGVGKVGQKAAVEVSKGAIRKYLTEMLTRKTAAGRVVQATTGAGAAEGGSISVIEDLARQFTEKAADRRTEIDPTQTMFVGAIGAGLGGTLGFAGGVATNALIRKAQGRKYLNSEIELSQHEQVEMLAEDMVLDRLRAEDFDEVADEVAVERIGKYIKEKYAGFNNVDELVEHATTHMNTTAADVRAVVGGAEDVVGRAREVINVKKQKFDPTKMVPRSGGIVGTKVEWQDQIWELVGRSKNGVYHLVSDATGETQHIRGRQKFDQEGIIIHTPSRPRSKFNSLGKMFDDDTQYILDLSEKSEIPGTAQPDHPEWTPLDRLSGEEAHIQDLMNGKPRASQWTPEEGDKIKRVVKKLGQRLAAQAHDLARKLGDEKLRGGVSMEDLGAFNHLHAQYKGARDLYRGVQSDALRLVAGMREGTNFANTASKQSAVKISLQMQGGVEGTEEAIHAIAEASGKGGRNWKGMAKVSDDGFGTRWSSMVTTRYNFMLSSIRTHVANIVGSSMTGVWEFGMVGTTRMAINNLEHYIRQAIPGASKMSPGDRYTLSSWKSELNGMVLGAREGAILAYEIMAGRRAIPKHLGVTKAANEGLIRYDPAKVPQSTGKKWWTSPVRLLDAEDSFFKSIYFNGKIANLAERKARAEAVVEGVSFEARFRHHRSSPSKEMITEASQFASRLTFTNDPSMYGTFLGGLAKASSKLQHAHPVFNMLLPFVKTPANIIGYSVNSVTGGATNVTKLFNDITGPDALVRSEAIAKVTIAAGMWMYVWGMWEDQTITGQGSPSPDVNRTMRGTGWRPNSIKVNDKYYSLERIEPAGIAINIIATTRDIISHLQHNGGSQQEMSTVLTFGIAAMADMLVDRSWLSSFADITAAATSGDARGIAHEAAGAGLSFFVPNVLRDVREYMDRNRREMEFRGIQDRMIKQIKNAIPGLSSELPSRIMWNGDYETTEAHPLLGDLWNATIPIKISKAGPDPAAAALANARVSMPKPGSKLSLNRDIPKASLDLMRMDGGEGFVYQKYQIEIGKMRSRAVNKVVNSGSFKRLAEKGQIGPNSIGARMLQDAVTQGTKAGKGKFLQWVRKVDKFTVNDGQKTIKVTHPFKPQEYTRLMRATVRGQPILEGETPQYLIRQPTQPFPKF